MTSTCAGQREALPKPSILSLRMPRTEEKGLWPIWKYEDADGNYEDDLDDNDNVNVEDRYAGDFFC